MGRTYIKRIFLIFQCVFIAFTIVSCSSTKKSKYFQDIPDSGQLKTIPKVEYIVPKIQVDDILTVIVQTVDPQASSLINIGNVGTSSPGMPSTTSTLPAQSTPNLASPAGYLVDKGGTITIPILGTIKIAGLTTSEASGVIKAIADKFYKDPAVIVRFANFKVNVAGEVLRPGTYIMPNEKVSVLDAISMAGDLTIFGKRDNVLLLRENPDGTKTAYRFNLKKSSTLSSPYFYLKQNDYIYVEPGKGKEASTDANAARNYTLIASFLSVLIVLLSRIN